MKRILIVGSESFIGTAVSDYFKSKDNYKIEIFDAMWIDPIEYDFKGYDVIIQAAGMEPCKKANKNPKLYYDINYKLAYETACVAKACEVRQFIVLSTMDVYGTKEKNVTKDTMPAPDSDYAKSKLKADEKILELDSNSFHACILRLPIAYGENEKRSGGAFNFWKKQVANRRKEKIHIQKVCELIEKLILEDDGGVFVSTV